MYHATPSISLVWLW